MPSTTTRSPEDLWALGVELADAGNLTGAIKAYLAAGKLGNVEAQSNLGVLLLDAVKPPRVREGLNWLRTAARNGLPYAAWNLAMHYRDANNRRRYRFWINRAAALGHADALALQPTK